MGVPDRHGLHLRRTGRSGEGTGSRLAEGRADQAKADVKQAAERVKDAFQR